MADFEELSFVIPGYTPETMPLDRLLEYLRQFSAVLGDPGHLHLVGMRNSSCAPVFHVPKADAIEARESAGRIQRGDGTKKQVDAYNRIRRMVRSDARDAGRPALLRSPERIVLEIPAAPDDLDVLSGVRQASSVDGQLIRLGGAGDDAHLQVQELGGKILSGFVATRTLAKQLAQLMWEPIRLHGMGLWGRDNEGAWFLERMQVQTFEPLEEEDVELTLERLRDLKVQWPSDALEKLLSERESGV